MTGTINMLTYTKGQILKTNTEAVINTVNTEGVMGKGIALAFKEAYPENYKLYRRASEKKEIKIGKMFVTEVSQIENPHYIINFPTKEHWRNPSKMEYIIQGLEDLVRVIKEKNIKSIAVPPLGCGNGKLNWRDVKPLIENALKSIEGLEAVIYEPSDEAYKESVKITKKKTELNPARAMVLSLFNRYRILGYDLTLLEAQKLAYFLQRLGENLRLRYKDDKYGPYADNLNHLLQALDGIYLSGMKNRTAKSYDCLTLNKDKLIEISEYLENNGLNEQKERLQQVYRLIDGFESPLGMELLATVDYVLYKNPELTKDTNALIKKVQEWSERKKTLMKPQYIIIAHKRLKQFNFINAPLQTTN